MLSLTATIMLVGIVLPFSPLGPKLGLEPLAGSYFLWLFAILLTYSVLTQMVKGWYIRKFATWL